MPWNGNAQMGSNSLLRSSFPFFSSHPAPRLFAHRGASGHRPENTMEAFSLALEMGVRYLELDVHTSRDGHVVVIHDRALERTTNGRGAVGEHLLTDLKKLDAGYHFVPMGGREPVFRGKGLRIPLLAEVLQEFPQAMLNIEVKQKKPPMEAHLWEVLYRNKALDRILLASEDGETLRRLRARFGPGVATGISREEGFRFMRWYLAGKKRPYKPEGQALQVPERIKGFDYISKGFVEAAHDLGLEVHVWTVNEVFRMKRFLELGVDGIITDFPERFPLWNSISSAQKLVSN